MWFWGFNMCVVVQQEEAAEVIERGKANRRPEMGLYGGDPVLRT